MERSRSHRGRWEDDTRRLISEIAEASRLPVGPDLDTLLRNAAAAQQRVVELEQARHLQSDHIDALRRTVEELRRKLADASTGDRPGLAAAFAASAQGNSLVAEDAFEREYDAQSRTAEEARQTMAEAARNVANLALLHDVAKAVFFYGKALAAEPEHAETARLLGHALILLGDLTGAERRCPSHFASQSRRGTLGEKWRRRSDLAMSFRRRRIFSAANRAFRAALGLAEQRRATDPANTEWQTDVAVSCAKLGTLDYGQSIEAQHNHLLHGREILLNLKSAGRLAANQDWIGWFDEQLAERPSGQS